ncbi:MAG: LexA family transcriptional regulator [Gammaproteobacteria bacterium]|nr:LexA family transcriptional regulator [Gammaproteobacteria bacterium]
MKKDLNYLSKLQDYYRDHRALPSYATMAEVLGLASKSAVHALIKRLVQAGFVSITPDRRVAPDDKFFERAMANSVVRAGIPGIADNDVLDGIAVDRYLIHNASSTLLVEVKGDSMMDAAILEGDIAVIDTSVTHKAGDIVIAEIDGEVTLKTLIKEQGVWALQPENSAYEIIRPQGEWRVVGVLVGLMRKYR